MVFAITENKLLDYINGFIFNNLKIREEGRGVHKVLVGKPERKNHWGDQDADGRIILRWIFRKWEGVVGTGRSWLRIGTGGGCL